MDQFSRLIYVEMKARRAQKHFSTLQAELNILLRPEFLHA
jgi:hypothetical protein